MCWIEFPVGKCNVNTLNIFVLGTCTIIAQCYDGASVMGGHVNRVHAQIRKSHKTATYIQRYAHRLNLVNVAVARQAQYAESFFAVVELLYVSMNCLLDSNKNVV